MLSAYALTFGGLLTALSIIATTFTGGPERAKALGIWGALGAVGATAQPWPPVRVPVP